jgi:leucine dehydrogenase
MVSLQERLAEYGHNEFKAFRDDAVGLKGFVGLHDTTLGPATGGSRRYAFGSEQEAIRDVLRLSRSMTYKYAISGINLGGAKAVIWVDDQDHCTEELYRSYGRIVDSFDGRWITGADVGTGERELRWINMETDYVVGLPEQFDHPEGFHGGGLGVVRAMEACCDLAYDDRDVGDLHVAIQGVGEMGMALVQYLSDRGTQLTVADVDQAAVDRATDEFGADSVSPDAVFGVDCDVVAPCALGGALNDETIPQLTCDIVCGAANNQLEDEEKHGQLLHEEGILYAPDYLANSGRTIDDTDLLRKGGYNHTRSRAMIDEIYDRMVEIGERAAQQDRPTYQVANEIARKRIENVDAARKTVRERRKPQW